MLDDMQRIVRVLQLSGCQNNHEVVVRVSFLGAVHPTADLVDVEYLPE